MTSQSTVSPRVLRVLDLIRRLNEREQSQLGSLLPPSILSPPALPDDAINEAVTYFQEQTNRRANSPSLDDPFIGGHTYREYFALSDEKADLLWEQLAAEAPTLESFPVIEARTDARLPVRQERRS